MNFKLAAAALILAGAFAALPGCAADTSQDDADAEEAGATEDELSAAAAKLVGAFHGQTAAQPPTFEGLVFANDGSFFGDLDTGIRCITAPCPSSAHLEGHYKATKSYVTLTVKAGEATSEYYGRYKYTLAGSKLTLSRTTDGSTWTQKLTKELSYCAEASDCGSQGLIHPMCAPGGWTCGSANTCSFHCGIIPVDNTIWPASATKLVASSAGGGFVGPAPAGSACTIGQQKYSLDRASRVMTFEACTFVAANKPLVLKKGTTTVTVAELAKINTAMNGVAIATEDNCGADKALLQIAVTTPAGQKTYTDSFYRCQGGSRTYVDGIDAVFTAMHDAAQ